MKTQPKQQQGFSLVSWEAERAVLCALMTKREVVGDIIAALDQDCFAFSEHRAVLAVAVDLFMRQVDVEMVSVVTELRKQGEFKNLKIADFLRDEIRESAIAWAAHIKILKELARKRAVRAALEEGIEGLQGKNVDEVVAEVTSQLLKNGGAAKRPEPMEKVTVLSVKRLERAMAKKTNVTGIASGFRQFDEMGGFQPGELIVLGGRPSVGKSALIGSVAIGAARHGQRCMIVNAEMQLVDVGTRFLARESGIENFELRRGAVSDDEYTRAVQASGRLSGLPILIYDEKRWEPIKAQVRATKQQYPDLALVLIDYVQRIRVKREGDENRYELIGRVAKEAKDMAIDLGIAVIVAAQISRAVEREKREPELSDLRESGDLEQDADVCCFLHRYKPEETWSVYWLIKKNRNGRLAKIHLRYIAGEVAYYDWDENADGE